jgi:large subunit ribosomal protein L14e
VFYGI